MFIEIQANELIMFGHGRELIVIQMNFEFSFGWRRSVREFQPCINLISIALKSDALIRWETKWRKFLYSLIDFASGENEWKESPFVVHNFKSHYEVDDEENGRTPFFSNVFTSPRDNSDDLSPTTIIHKCMLIYGLKEFESNLLIECTQRAVKIKKKFH